MFAKRKNICTFSNISSDSLDQLVETGNDRYSTLVIFKYLLITILVYCYCTRVNSGQDSENGQSVKRGKNIHSTDSFRLLYSTISLKILIFISASCML